MQKTKFIQSTITSPRIKSNMSLQIIGVGFGRTGTLSTKTALNQLGYPCYHMFEVTDNPDNKTHLDFWNRVANAPTGQQHNWAEVFANYTATVDNPGCAVWPQLLAAYPNAKVLLTLHPKGPEAWYKSTKDTIYAGDSLWQFKLLQLFIPPFKKMGNMTRKLVWQGILKGTMENKEAATQRYLEHIEEVKAVVPAENLLIFKVSEGWAPLCNFLEIEKIPTTPFPRVNDREQIKTYINNMMKGAYLILFLGALIFLALVYGIYTWVFSF